MSNIVIEQLQAAQAAMRAELEGMDSRRKTLELSITDTEKLLARLTKSSTGVVLALAAPTARPQLETKRSSPTRNEIGVDEWSRHAVAVFTEQRRPLTAYDLDRLLKLQGVTLKGRRASFDLVRGRLHIRPNLFERHGKDTLQGRATYWLTGVAVPAPDNKEPLKSVSKPMFRKLTDVQEQYRNASN